MAEGPSGVQSAAIPGQQTNSQKQTKLDSLTSENKSDDTKTQARAGCNRYENIDEVKRVKKDGSSSYENISKRSEPPKDKRPLQTHRSDPVLGATRNPVGEDAGSVKPCLETVLPMARLPISKNEDCQQCGELLQLLSLWELGVSGLARNYSRILAQLNKAQDAVACLESKMKARAEVEGMKQSFKPRADSAASLNKRHTVMAEELPSEGIALANQMYPQAEDSIMSTDQALPSDYVKYLGELNAYLGAAIDLCQQLAAACFKSNQVFESQSLAQEAQRSKTKNPVKKQVSQPPGQAVFTPPSSPFRPSLSSISESSPTGTLKRLQGDAVQSSDSQHVLAKLTNGSANEEERENGKKTEESSAGERQCEPSSENKPFHSHMMSLIEASAGRDIAPSFVLLDSTDAEDVLSRDPKTAAKGTFSSGSRDSVLSSTSTFSENDVKQVMSKIAGLEEERLKLLETVNGLQDDNQQVRLSLYETLSDLENKDLQLTLAMQDLTIAIDEIKRATQMRAEVEHLGNERTALLERLSNLEDESAAVKVSLIHLLQEKSATNKTLALENSRLTQRMRQLATVTNVGNSSPSATVRRSSSETDNVSVSSFATGSEVDAGLQEAYFGLDDAGCYVHKQGFLVKQGGKVKNWKKRLFVLDSEGLSYFKTDRPIQKLHLSRIEKVQICHGRTQYPNMFEVHTQDRIFYLSAITHDEMQSWVGMLQTLKQYHQRRQPREESSVRAPLPVFGGESSDEAPPSLVQRETSPQDHVSLDVRASLPSQLLHQNGESSDHVGAFSKSVPAAVAGFIESDEETLTAGGLDLAQLKAE